MHISLLLGLSNSKFTHKFLCSGQGIKVIIEMFQDYNSIDETSSAQSPLKKNTVEIHNIYIFLYANNNNEKKNISVTYPNNHI